MREERVERDRRPESLLQRYAVPLRVYAVSRVIVLACAAVSATALRSTSRLREPWPESPGPRVALVEALTSWDGAWLVHIAQHGYGSIEYRGSDQASTAFFPGYPLLVGLVARLTFLPVTVVAILVSTALGAVAASLAWRLVTEISGPAAARRAVTLFCFAPGAFVLSIAYSESLFLVAAVGGVLAAMHRRWVVAGLLGALGTATRPTGVAVVATLVVVAGAAWWSERDRRAIVAPALAPLGVLCYFAFQWARTGDALAWFVVQRTGWDDRIAPVASVTHRMRELRASGISLEPAGLNDAIWLVSSLVAVLLVVALARWRPPLPVLVYAVTAIGFALMSFRVGLRPRMVLLAFPVVLAPGVVLREAAYRVVLVLSAASLVALSLLTFSTIAATP